MRNAIFAGLVASSFAVGVDAQQAMQWKVSDGGNGHWYALPTPALSWPDAQTWAASRGAHLATFTSASEQDFFWAFFAAQILPDPFFIGCYQAPGVCEPGCGWKWITDEQLDYSRWLPGEPNDNRLNGNEDAVCINASNLWNDLAGQLSIRFAVEWSADCNNDGIVDYGQCRDGSLPDYNGNNIPDCCEQGTTCVVGNYSVQWRVSEGGNGHWYFRLAMPLTSWEACRIEALQRGGDLVSFSSLAEYQAALRVITEEVSTSRPSPVWLGATCPVGSSGSTDWSWIDGTPWEFTAWCSFSPNNGPEQMRYLIHYTYFGCWDDFLASDACCHVGGAIMEWSSDCNDDGIVDKGQILAGQLADSDNNGVPDVCQEPSCRDADFFRDLNVNGADLGVLLSQWGPNTPFTVSDLTGDGAVDGDDLGIFLSFWGPCP